MSISMSNPSPFSPSPSSLLPTLSPLALSSTFPTYPIPTLSSACKPYTHSHLNMYIEIKRNTVKHNRAQVCVLHCLKAHIKVVNWIRISPFRCHSITGGDNLRSPQSRQALFTPHLERGILQWLETLGAGGGAALSMESIEVRISRDSLLGFMSSWGFFTKRFRSQPRDCWSIVRAMYTSWFNDMGTGLSLEG